MAPVTDSRRTVGNTNGGAGGGAKRDCVVCSGEGSSREKGRVMTQSLSATTRSQSESLVRVASSSSEMRFFFPGLTNKIQELNLLAHPCFFPLNSMCLVAPKREVDVLFSFSHVKKEKLKASLYITLKDPYSANVPFNIVF